MPVVRGRVEQALCYSATGSDDETRLRVALGHALWYSNPDSDALEPSFARALHIAERIGATVVQTQALWGMWAARRGRCDYSGALETAHRYVDVAKNAGYTGAIHLGDRILALTNHMLGHQPIAREFAERALRQPPDFDLAAGIGYEVETPVATGALLARILWLGASRTRQPKWRPKRSWPRTRILWGTQWFSPVSRSRRGPGLQPRRVARSIFSSALQQALAACRTCGLAVRLEAH